MNYDNIFQNQRRVSTALGWDYYYYDLGNCLLVYKPDENKISIEPKTFNTKTSDDIPEDILKQFREFIEDPLFEIEKKKMINNELTRKSKQRKEILDAMKFLKNKPITLGFKP